MRVARGSVRAACNSAGLVVAAWVSLDGAVMTSRLGPGAAAAWSAPVAALPAPPADPTRVPPAGGIRVDVAVTPAGGAYLAATNAYTVGAPSLRLLEAEAVSGSWGAPRPLLQDDPGVQFPWDRPDVSVDDAGHAVLVWAQGTWQGVIGALSHVYALRYDPAAGRWDQQPTRLSVRRSRVSAPLAAIDPRGDVTVAWSAFDDVSPSAPVKPQSHGMQAARFDAAAGAWQTARQLPWEPYLHGTAQAMAVGADAAGSATVAYYTLLSSCLIPPRDFNDDCPGSLSLIRTVRYDAARDAWTAAYDHVGTYLGNAMAAAPDGSVALLTDTRRILTASRFGPPAGPGLVMRGMYRILSVPFEDLFAPITYLPPVTTAAVGSGVWFIADTYRLPAGTPVILTRDGTPQGRGVVGPDLAVSIPWTRPGITAGAWQITIADTASTESTAGYATDPLQVTTVPRFGIASHAVRGSKVTFTVNPGNAIAPWQQVWLTHNGRAVAVVQVKRQFTPLAITVANRPGVYQVRTPMFDRWEYGARGGVTVLR